MAKSKDHEVSFGLRAPRGGRDCLWILRAGASICLGLQHQRAADNSTQVQDDASRGEDKPGEAHFFICQTQDQADALRSLVQLTEGFGFQRLVIRGAIGEGAWKALAEDTPSYAS